MAIEGASKYEFGQANGMLEGLANQIHQVVIGEPRTKGRAPWMNEDDRAEFFGHPPERIVHSLGNVSSIDQCRDLHAFESSIANQHLQLFAGAHWILECYCAERDKTVRMRRVHCSDLVILTRDDFIRQVPFGPVVILCRRGTYRLDVHSHRIHILQSMIYIDELWHQSLCQCDIEGNR